MGSEGGGLEEGTRTRPAEGEVAVKYRDDTVPSRDWAGGTSLLTCEGCHEADDDEDDGPAAVWCCLADFLNLSWSNAAF